MKILIVGLAVLAQGGLAWAACCARLQCMRLVFYHLLYL
jgi:hypothetical protein